MKGGPEKPERKGARGENGQNVRLPAGTDVEGDGDGEEDKVGEPCCHER